MNTSLSKKHISKTYTLSLLTLIITTKEYWEEHYPQGELLDTTPPLLKEQQQLVLGVAH